MSPALGIDEDRLWGLVELLMATGYPMCFRSEDWGYMSIPDAPDLLWTAGDETDFRMTILQLALMISTLKAKLREFYPCYSDN